MRPPAAALFFSFSILAAPLAACPALAHSLDEVQSDLSQRETAVAFEPDVGSPFPAFHLQDVDGQAVDLASLRGKVVVLDFVSAACTDGCGAGQKDGLGDLMARIQADVAAGKMTDQVQLVTITLDPAHDTPDVRKAYGPAHGLNPQNWRFLAGGSADDMRQLARAAGLKFERRPDGSFTHPPVTFVIDSAGMLRAKFFGLKFDPLNLIIYVNALTNDHHELEPPPGKTDTSFWQAVKRLL